MAVVLGYDESPGAEAALDAAISIAEKFGEGLVLVYGAGPPGGVGRGVQGAPRRPARPRPRPPSSHALERAQAAGVDTTIEVVDAKPAEALVQAADWHDASVIVVGTAGESPLRGAILGSTPHKLLHLSHPCSACRCAG